uniref:(northern house mosquito) hypothetical protein n=1 Tax=Culex pipiens TaxID=7175 RepID=A0A8D8LB96_CULPI
MAREKSSKRQLVRRHIRWNNSQLRWRLPRVIRMETLTPIRLTCFSRRKLMEVAVENGTLERLPIRRNMVSLCIRLRGAFLRMDQDPEANTWLLNRPQMRIATRTQST